MELKNQVNIMKQKMALYQQQTLMSQCYVRICEAMDRIQQDFTNIEAHKKAIKDLEEKLKVESDVNEDEVMDEIKSQCKDIEQLV